MSHIVFFHALSRANRNNIRCAAQSLPSRETGMNVSTTSPRTPLDHRFSWEETSSTARVVVVETRLAYAFPSKALEAHARLSAPSALNLGVQKMVGALSERLVGRRIRLQWYSNYTCCDDSAHAPSVGAQVESSKTEEMGCHKIYQQTAWGDVWN